MPTVPPEHVESCYGKVEGPEGGSKIRGGRPALKSRLRVSAAAVIVAALAYEPLCNYSGAPVNLALRIFRQPEMPQE
jgi:hypothetical protein